MWEVWFVIFLIMEQGLNHGAFNRNVSVVWAGDGEAIMDSHIALERGRVFILRVFVAVRMKSRAAAMRSEWRRLRRRGEASPNGS